MCRRNMRCSATPLVDHDSLCDSDEMAIAFARARYISRSTGGSAARSAAYNARAEIGDERTGEVFYFKHRDAPEHHEVLAPEGADEKFSDAATLVERGGGGGAAQGFSSRPRNRHGLAGERRGFQRRPYRTGALLRAGAFRRQGARGSARHSRAARRRSGERARQFSRASFDYDKKHRGRSSVRDEGARSCAGHSAGGRAELCRGGRRMGRFVARASGPLFSGAWDQCAGRRHGDACAGAYRAAAHAGGDKRGERAGEGNRARQCRGGARSFKSAGGADPQQCDVLGARPRSLSLKAHFRRDRAAERFRTGAWARRDASPARARDRRGQRTLHDAPCAGRGARGAWGSAGARRRAPS